MAVISAWTAVALTLLEFIDRALGARPAGTDPLTAVWAWTTGTIAGASRVLSLVVLIGLLVLLHGPDRVNVTPRVRPSDAVLVVLLAALTLSETLAGHPAAVSGGRLASVLAGTVHVAAAAVWIGALACLLVLARPVAGGGQRAVMRACRVRLSVLLATTVSALVVSGIYQSGRQVDTVPQIVETPYGVMILVKCGLLIMMIGLALANFASLHEIRGAPRAVAPGGAAGGRTSGVLLEGLIGLAVLAVASLLVGTEPPRTIPTTLTATEPARTIGGTTADLVYAVSITPNRPGYNGFSVSLASTRRPAPAPVDVVHLEITDGAALRLSAAPARRGRRPVLRHRIPRPTRRAADPVDR